MATQKLSLAAVHTSYSALLINIKKTLLEGQARIENERLRVYWDTGRLIVGHVLQSQDRARRNQEVIVQLSQDLAVSETLLHRCVKFARKYPRFPKVAGRPLLSWSHYRGLITIEDDRKRRRLEQAAEKNAWSADELALKIKENSVGKPVPDRSSSKSSSRLLTPRRGTPYTYQLVERPNLPSGENSGLLVDLGFGIFYDVAPSRRGTFQKNQIVESRFEDNVAQLRATPRGLADLFTYAAYIEKVIDGDTLKVRLDLGFNIWHRETLRLRDIDCPEVGTSKGDEAKNFVRALLKEAQLIIVRTSRSDKYDRYLADIFIPPEDKPNAPSDTAAEVYLNNLLLEKGLAERM